MLLKSCPLHLSSCFLLVKIARTANDSLKSSSFSAFLNICFIFFYFCLLIQRALSSIHFKIVFIFFPITFMIGDISGGRSFIWASCHTLRKVIQLTMDLYKRKQMTTGK